MVEVFADITHRLLPEEKRNVTVYLHSSIVTADKETIDLHTRRIAENKAKQMGEVELVLKENAVDCLVHKGQNHIQRGESSS